MERKCSKKSIYRDDERYECNPGTGRYRLKRGYKKQTVQGAPKKPLSSYFLWAQQNRGNFKKQNEGLKVTELAKIMGEAWRNLSDYEKSQYKQQALTAKNQYGEKAAQFKNQSGSLTEIVKKPKQKKSPSAFILFSQNRRPQIKEDNPELTFGQIAKTLGNLWNELDDDEKDHWRQQAAQYKQ